MDRDCSLKMSQNISPSFGNDIGKSHFAKLTSSISLICNSIFLASPKFCSSSIKCAKPDQIQRAGFIRSSLFNYLRLLQAGICMCAHLQCSNKSYLPPAFLSPGEGGLIHWGSHTSPSPITHQPPHPKLLHWVSWLFQRSSSFPKLRRNAGQRDPSFAPS